ncbi:MAG: GNAT family N-acetyltransferase [Rhodospirillales bacterium]|nr:GNAT family N-acetyltransferase [Rhodospirillales bacterium]
MPKLENGLTIRNSEATDVPSVVKLDARITGINKADYWADMFERYGKRENRYFLVADDPEGKVVGFIIGEVRAWEFGSPPSGWVFALGVDPDARLMRVGTTLFESICACLKKSGVDTVRTMLARDDELNMSFFRSLGMMGGPFIQLEMGLSALSGDAQAAGEKP